MSESSNRLRPLDELQPSNLWSRIEQTEPREWQPETPSIARRIATAALALAIGAAGVWLVIARLSGGGVHPAVTPSPSAVVGDRSVGEGVSAGVSWTLVADERSEGASILELRRSDNGEVVAAVTSDGSDLPVVSGYAFGEGDPTDAVVFGLVSPETASVTLNPGSGLPKEDEPTVPVLGTSMRAFALTAYVPNGIVRAKDSSGGAIAEELLVLPGEEPVLRLVERFLSARIEGSGAEAFVAPNALREFGPPLDLEPLYATRDGRPYADFAVVFIDAAGDSFEVGVRLDVDGQRAVEEETLGIGPAKSQEGEERLLVVGGRSGLTGP
jgi:hypothetical protein